SWFSGGGSSRTSRSPGSRAEPSCLDIGCEVEHAVAGLDAAETAAADHHAVGLEMARHRLARRIVDEMHATRELLRRDILPEVDCRLEHAVIGRVDIVMPALDFHEPGGLKRRISRFLVQNAEMGEETPDAGLDKCKPGSADGSA